MHPRGCLHGTYHHKRGGRDEVGPRSGLLRRRSRGNILSETVWDPATTCLLSHKFTASHLITCESTVPQVDSRLRGESWLPREASSSRALCLARASTLWAGEMTATAGLLIRFTSVKLLLDATCCLLRPTSGCLPFGRQRRPALLLHQVRSRPALLPLKKAFCSVQS